MAFSFTRFRARFRPHTGPARLLAIRFRSRIRWHAIRAHTRRMVRRPLRSPWFGLGLGLLVLLSGGWAADGLKGEHLLGGWSDAFVPYRGVILAAVLALFLGSSVLLYRARGAFIPVRTLSQRAVQPHRCVIAPLSPPVPFEPVEMDDGRIRIGDRVLPSGTLAEDIARLDGSRWTWQQLLRGIQPHEPTLERLVLLGSLNGSQPYLAAAAALVRAYLPNVDVRLVPAVGFDDLQRLVDELIEQVRSSGYPEDQIVIDVTGGQKTTSIAGAVITLNTDVKFQYVQTTSPHEVLCYDLRLTSSSF